MPRETRLPNEALRQTRLSRGWSLEETAEQIRHLAFRLGEPEPGVDGNMDSRWERGLHRPGPRYVRLLSLLLDEAPADLGLPSPTSGPLPGRASETYELARHASVSEVDTAALDDLERAVDRLSRDLDQALRARGEVREVKDFHQHYIAARRGGEPKADW